MTTILITIDDYIRFRTELSEGTKKPPIKRVLSWVILFSIITLSILFKQYAFLGIILLFVGVILWAKTRKGSKRFYRGEYSKDLFINDEFSANFSKQVFKISTGLNEISLAVNDLELVRTLTECYYLRHKSGISIFVPYKDLNEEEESYLKAYQSQLSDEKKPNKAIEATK